MSTECVVSGCGFRLENEGDLAEHVAARHSGPTRIPQVVVRREFLAHDIKALRDLGVHRFKGEGVELEFFDRPRAEEALIPRAMTQNAPHEEDKCACGHIQPAHNADGLCLIGCPVEKCASGPKP